MFNLIFSRMKKLVTLFALSALAVLAGCQREIANDTQEDTGVKEVTTQFVLNVAAVPQTKMSADVVQQNGNFRGIEHAKLFCYKTGITSGTPYVLNTTAPAEGDFKEYDLSDLMSAGQISGGDANQANSSKRILNLSIPVGVDAVMMYGKAIKAANSSDADYGCTYDYDFRDPYKANTVSSTPASTQFYSHPILDEENTDEYNATGDLMIAVINDILGTKGEAVASATVGPVGNKKTFTDLPELSWAQLGHQYEIEKFGDDSRYEDSEDNVNAKVILGRDLIGLEEILGKCYYLFTYIKPSNIPSTYTPGTDAWKDYILEHFGQENFEDMAPMGEYRGGSSFAVKKMIIDMYRIIKTATETIPTTKEEGNATRLAELILARATQFFSTEDGTYQSISVIKQALGNSWSPNYDDAKDLNDYPGYFGIPEGAAQLGFHVQGKDNGNGGTFVQDEFYYHHPNNYPLVNPTMTEFPPRKYLHPAELWYYVNSPIRTTSDEATVASYPNGVTPWSTEDWTNASWNTTGIAWDSPGKVSTSTRAVAVKNSVNYGVALLKSVITTTATKLMDNRAALTEETTDRGINVSESQISLTGVLVGGVNPRMNWQFTRFYTQKDTPSSTNDLSLFDGVIYDKSTGNPALPSGDNQVVNYTLVYDNYNSEGGVDKQNDVFLALEFKNGGDAFWGRDNLIPSGGTFYLVGKLPRPTQAQSDALPWPTDHQIPPLYGINGATDYSGVTASTETDPKPGDSKKIGRVFIQDFMTTANIKIGEDALKKAYYSVPDLRSSQMSLGLSIDLKWTTGLSYDVIF